MRLPHWEVDRGLYFVTHRLSCTIPRSELARLKELAQGADNQRGDKSLQVQRRIFIAFDNVLDSQGAIQHPTNPEVANMCMEAVRHRYTRGTWKILEYVKMPNHLHLFTHLTEGSLYECMVGFKRWTASQAKRILKTTGSFWQREGFDEWSDSVGRDQDIVNYIRQNPVKAGPATHFTDWRYASWSDPELKRTEFANW